MDEMELTKFFKVFLLQLIIFFFLNKVKDNKAIVFLSTCLNAMFQDQSKFGLNLSKLFFLKFFLICWIKSFFLLNLKLLLVLVGDTCSHFSFLFSSLYPYPIIGAWLLKKMPFSPCFLNQFSLNFLKNG